MTDEKRLTGCGFLAAKPDETHAPLLTPETVPEDYALMIPLLRNIARDRLDPVVGQLEERGGDAHRAHMEHLGTLGALGIEIPERFGGLELGPIAAACALEGLGTAHSGSFLGTYGAHTGIGTAPLLYFGTEEQKTAYLPGIAAGWTIAAYALTEPDSGSDALAAKTRATRQPDGSWLLNGEKSFITNGGLADLFTVFAKVDGKNACFLVERGLPGFTTGAEENKLGIRGSSTRSLSFQDVRLPPEALLGEIGQGHKIVFNTLNLGRFKIGAVCTGGLKSSLRDATRYALDRKQFGRSIAEFGAIRQMLARTAIDTYVVESTAYAVAGLLEDSLAHKPQGEAAAKALHEYSAECALLKVLASDALYDAADREVQVLGGYGAMEDYPAPRRLRDARTIRIFEGTNEVNRLAAIGEFLKRVVRGEIVLPDTSVFVSEDARIRFSLLRLIMAAAEDFGPGIMEEQPVLLELASLMGQVFSLQCAFGRMQRLTRAMTPTTEQKFATNASLAYLARYDAALDEASRRIISYASHGGRSGKLSALQPIFRGFNGSLIYESEVAQAVIAAGGYPL